MLSATLLVALLSGLAAASSIPKSLISLPSVIHPTTFIPLPSPVPDETSFIPLPTPVHSSALRPIATPPPYYQHIHDVLTSKVGAGNEERGEDLEARKESCWERVDGWCAPYCDGQFPGPDAGAKRNACAICIAVQSAFCLA
ncbi:hypothetical protein BDV96DRAFT_286871 [Lophiotrema nucula]|uniref:Kazal-like domain-containing protein n=1 Tax=Lophiotrema nucula TaxID=690887 RepID=A0A6A5YLR6_9PLEO|nr:hypothetical protein BDV96DRAFT_286871 [Lophiotrema nucula]